MLKLRTAAVVGAGVLCSMGIYFYLWGANSDSIEVELPGPPYENMYPLGLPVDEVRNNETEENMKNGIVEEETPKGRVLLQYCEDENSFHYWSDYVQDYKYLEVSARKYVILFDCKDKYINIFRELVKSIEKHEADEQKKKNKEESKKSVFATFKTYDSTGTPKLANEDGNIYKWKGKLNDRCAVSSTKTIESDNKRNVSYLEYKGKN
jgi:hypothetical protein